MKYKLHKLVNGNLFISDDIILTNETPSIVIDSSDIESVVSFNTYLKDNPFCRVVKINEEVKSFKKVK